MTPGHIDVALRSGEKGPVQVKENGKPEKTIGYIIAKAGLNLDKIQEEVEQQLGTTPP